MERKFKFVGDPDDWGLETFLHQYPEDWQEVTEPETTRIPNQNMPASSMTKLEYVSAMFVQGLISANGYPDIESSISKAKELLEQLDQIK